MLDIGFEDFTNKQSNFDTKQYVENLNTQVIEETSKLLGDIDGIRSAFEIGWIGQSERNYVANLQKSVEQVQSTLEDLRKTFNHKFVEIEEKINDIDDTIIPLQ